MVASAWNPPGIQSDIQTGYDSKTITNWCKGIRVCKTGTIHRFSPDYPPKEARRVDHEDNEKTNQIGSPTQIKTASNERRQEVNSITNSQTFNSTSNSLQETTIYISCNKQLNTRHFYRTDSWQKYSTGDAVANIAYTFKNWSRYQIYCMPCI